MRLRIIFLILAFLALFSTAVGGYYYYSNLKLNFTSAVDRDAVLKVSSLKNHLSSFFAEQLKPVRALAGLNEIRQVLQSRDENSLKNANAILDHFMVTLGADVCYLMDQHGLTIASSNRLDEDSFVSKNFAFRPYFQQALRGTPHTYMALGTASGKRGVYYSYPVLDAMNRQPIGVAVIKASAEIIEEEFVQGENEFLFLTDPNGIIFIASQQKWLFHSIWQLSEQAREQVATSRQFGDGPWEWLGMKLVDDKAVRDGSGRDFYMYQLPLNEFPGWQLIYIRDIPSLFTAELRPALRTAGAFILPLFLLIGGAVFVLYRKASQEIKQRKSAEQALRESEQRYRTLYLQTPALLHSIDPAGNIVSVSDYWTEILEYRREEVVGRSVTDFMSEKSKYRAEHVVIPQFLETGFCKDIPYTFIKKNGETLDVLLSAIAERDDAGNIRRSLAILLDITELKKVEEKLREEEQRRQMSASILNSQERERAAISRELHDELGQILTALRMDAVWLHDKLNVSEKDLADRSYDMCLLIDKTIDEVRKMAMRLRPGVLDDLGLLAALEWLVDDFENRSGISCTFRPQNIPEVDDPVATAIYRITQEALTNVARHSQAAHAEVSLYSNENELILSVADDGRGFVNASDKETNGLGIAGIRERSTLIDAEMEIETKEGEGTIVVVKIPLQQEGEKVSVSL